MMFLLKSSYLSKLPFGSWCKQNVLNKSSYVPFFKFSTGVDNKVCGLMLGVFSKGNGSELEYTQVTKHFDTKIEGRLTSLFNSFKPSVFSDEVKQRVFYNLSKEFPIVSVVHIGNIDDASSELECISLENEQIRIAVGKGVKALIDAGVHKVFVDDCGNKESAAESSNLVGFKYDDLKKKKKKEVEIELYSDKTSEWNCGVVKANSQKFAMKLMESPCNIITPQEFSKQVSSKLKSFSTVSLKIRDLEELKEMKMGAFLSVAKGSDEKPCLLEINYKGGNASDSPVILVGKGITFDSGGISLKPAHAMDRMRADMGGAAVVAASIFGAASLNLNINVKGIIPLAENMPSGKSFKPGDVVIAKNGTSIQVDNTDAEGRLILADALVYAQSYNPVVLIDIATLTGAMSVALGSGAAGTFTNTSKYLEILEKASFETGDRIWHMPLFKQYSEVIKKCDLADLNNIGKSRDAGACTAAAFLKEFIGSCKWIHLDIAGVMENDGEISYLPKGMSGRPTRTVIEFLRMCSMK